MVFSAHIFAQQTESVKRQHEHTDGVRLSKPVLEGINAAVMKASAYRIDSRLLVSVEKDAV